MSRQVITAPNGDRLVVMPEAEYEALVEAVEDAEDRAVVDAYDRAAAAGLTDPVPSEIVDRLLSGAESKVRIWREHRGLSAVELARAAELSAPYVSQIESGRREPGIDALKRLAAALKVDIDDLV
ncbi:MAG: helix-turn-helix transcriptional regulator [Oceanicaulis sp.]